MLFYSPWATLCHGRTDRQTDISTLAITALCIASWRAVKKPNRHIKRGYSSPFWEIWVIGTVMASDCWRVVKNMHGKLKPANSLYCRLPPSVLCPWLPPRRGRGTITQATSPCGVWSVPASASAAEPARSYRCPAWSLIKRDPRSRNSITLSSQSRSVQECRRPSSTVFAAYRNSWRDVFGQHHQRVRHHNSVRYWPY